eukprot:scaffold388574_cov50-Prasinocladus_malaysianus.AAC.1
MRTPPCLSDVEQHYFYGDSRPTVSAALQGNAPLLCQISRMATILHRNVTLQQGLRVQGVVKRQQLNRVSVRCSLKWRMEILATIATHIVK